MSDLIVNGKHYPLWSQFVEKSDEYKGGTLIETNYGETMTTAIEKLTLEPNGEDSAFFSVVGKDFTCGFDVQHGGISGCSEFGEEYLAFSGSYGLSFGIKKP